MTEVTGKYFLTITAEADEVYYVTGTALRRVDILNKTESDIHISADSDFAAENGIASYITIPAGVASNGIYTPSLGLYIKAAADGDIVIMGAE